MKAGYWVLAALPALLGCTDPPPVPGISVPSGGDDAITRGFVCTTTPTAAYSPGYVFRRDESGSQLLVDMLSDQAKVYRAKTLFGTYTANLARSAGLKFTLDTAIEDISASGDLGASSGQTTKVSFTDGELVQMTDRGVNEIIRTATADLVPVSGSTYFVVRDSIQAKAFDITLTRNDQAHLGGQVGVRNIVNADPSLSFQGDSGLVINGTFPEPLNVCLRAVRMEPLLVAEPAPGVEPPIVAEPAPVGGPVEDVTWRVTTTAATASDFGGLLSE